MSSPEAMVSELLYSAQFNSPGMVPLPEPEKPALAMPSSGTASPSLESNALMAALELVVTFSLSSLTIRLLSSMRQSLALTEPTSIPSEYFILRNNKF